MLFWNSLIMTPVRWGSRKGRDGNGIGQESHIEMYFVFLPFFLVMTSSLFTLRATVFYCTCHFLQYYLTQLVNPLPCFSNFNRVLLSLSPLALAYMYAISGKRKIKNQGITNESKNICLKYHFVCICRVYFQQCMSALVCLSVK